MYRNFNKSKLIANLSTEYTIDSLKFTKNKHNTSHQTANNNQKSIDESKEDSVSYMRTTKDKQSSKYQFKLKFTKNNNNDLIKKKIIKGKLMKLINNASLEQPLEEEVVGILK